MKIARHLEEKQVAAKRVGGYAPDLQSFTDYVIGKKVNCAGKLVSC